ISPRFAGERCMSGAWPRRGGPKMCESDTGESRDPAIRVTASWRAHAIGQRWVPAFAGMTSLGRHPRSRRGFPRGFVVFLTLILIVNAIGFSFSELLGKLGPPPIGDAIAYSQLVVDRDGKLLRPFATKDGYWRLPAGLSDVDPRF